MSKPYSKSITYFCKDTGEKVTGDKYLHTKHWRGMREKAYEYYKGVCQRCGGDISLDSAEIHHRIYKRMGEENVSDLILYCKHCHHCLHKNRKGVHEANKGLHTLIPQLTASEKEEAYNILVSHFGLKGIGNDEGKEYRINKIQHEIKTLKKQLRRLYKEGETT